MTRYRRRSLYRNAVLVLGICSPLAIADNWLSVTADTPVVQLLPRTPGRSFVRLPALEFNFSVEVRCRDDWEPRSMSLSVADTRKAFDGDQFGEDGLRSFGLRVPARQIAPMAVEEFCIAAPDPAQPTQLTVSGALSAHASLLCGDDTEQKMTYVTRPLDVVLECGSGDAEETEE